MKNRLIKKFLVSIILFFVIVVSLIIGKEILLIYSEIPPQTICEEIPEGSVIFAPAFNNLGKKENGDLRPGKANENIAEKLEKCADRFELVMTQKAISDALDNPNELKNGIPIFQMHRHDDSINVRTLQTFVCALDRFIEPPDQIVLIAHPRHLDRAFFNLDALYSSKIIKYHLGDVSYATNAHWRAYLWALKNSIAWLLDRFKVASLKKSNSVIDCPDEVCLKKISKVDGKWQSVDIGQSIKND